MRTGTVSGAVGDENRPHPVPISQSESLEVHPSDPDVDHSRHGSGANSLKASSASRAGRNQYSKPFEHDEYSWGRYLRSPFRLDNSSRFQLVGTTSARIAMGCAEACALPLVEVTREFPSSVRHRARFSVSWGRLARSSVASNRNPVTTIRWAGALDNG